MAEKIGFSTDFRLSLFLPVCLAPYSARSCCEGGIRALSTVTHLSLSTSLLQSPFLPPSHSKPCSSQLSSSRFSPLSPPFPLLPNPQSFEYSQRRKWKQPRCLKRLHRVPSTKRPKIQSLLPRPLPRLNPLLRLSPLLILLQSLNSLPSTLALSPKEVHHQLESSTTSLFLLVQDHPIPNLATSTTDKTTQSTSPTPLT